MKDFYSLFAYFNSIDGSPMDGNIKDHAPVLAPADRRAKSEIRQAAGRAAASSGRDRRIGVELQSIEEPLIQLSAKLPDVVRARVGRR